MKGICTFYIILGFTYGFLVVEITNSWDPEDGPALDDNIVVSKDPNVVFWQESIIILRGVSCRGGFNNVSDDLLDAMAHCSKISTKYEQKGRPRRRFGKDVVDFNGPTPYWCFQACVAVELDWVRRDNDNTGLNRTSVYKTLKQQFLRPGGEKSAYILTEEMMECDRKFPTKFPTNYVNCTEVQDLSRCGRKIWLDCSDKTQLYSKKYEEFKKLQEITRKSDLQSQQQRGISSDDNDR